MREGVPAEEEAKRYREWAAGLPVPPTRFCNPSEPRQAVAQRFAALAGLPHLTEQQVTLVRDKAAMKARFRELGLRTAEFTRVWSSAEVERFAGRHGWPVVLKPVDSFACVDTYRLAGPGDLAGIDLTARQWMVEEHLGGTEWEVCAIILGGEVLDAWPSAMPCRPLDIVDGAMNANISVGTDEGPPVDVRALVQRIATGMGIDHGYAHMEFFLIDGEVYAGEIGVRLAGCEIPANHGHAYGFDVFGATLAVYLGRRPGLDYRERRCAGDLLLPLPGSGTIRRITPGRSCWGCPASSTPSSRSVPVTGWRPAGPRTTPRGTPTSWEGRSRRWKSACARCSTASRSRLSRLGRPVSSPPDPAVPPARAATRHPTPPPRAATERRTTT